ncbi:MAG TPA: tol-pal system-associated acyl-CoA thioesterase [Steroidobacteraceae bacterium]|nr:tol-pal system-associated acyl-CoA thioesterase [Steroidobacteraceae bacterium]
MSVFAWPARVYWEDTDAGGIVYYANYLRFLERARTEWLRSLGHSQRALVEEQGVVFTVVSLEADYRRPARLDDELMITCEPRVEGAASVRFGQRIFRGTGEPDSERLLLQASVRVACLDAQTLKPKRLPEFLLRSTIERAPPRGRSSRSQVE